MMLTTKVISSALRWYCCVAIRKLWVGFVILRILIILSMKAKYVNLFTDFKAFEKAELSKFDQSERDVYENSLKIYRDLKGVIDTAWDEGKIEVAKAMKENGATIDFISKTTGLSVKEIEEL